MRIERLEDRICPSGLMPGDSTIEPGTGMESDSAAIDSEMNRYEWIMMAMSPGDMMKIANEVDQSAKAPGQAMAEPGIPNLSKVMSISNDSATAGESMMAESNAMPPAQMIMASEPLVRPGSSSSRRIPEPMSGMTESKTNEANQYSEKNHQGSMAGDEAETSGDYEPPLLAPGDLDPKLDPSLAPGPITPFLEQSTPSVSAP